MEVAREEAMAFLDEGQYAHVVGLFQELAREIDPTRPESLRVEKVEDFFELKDKGGVLGKINLRVFFIVTGRSIVVLCAIKKEADGQTPMWAKIRTRYRLRNFSLGAYGPIA